MTNKSLALIAGPVASTTGLIGANALIHFIDTFLADRNYISALDEVVNTVGYDISNLVLSFAGTRPEAPGGSILKALPAMYFGSYLFTHSIFRSDDKGLPSGINIGANIGLASMSVYLFSRTNLKLKVAMIALTTAAINPLIDNILVSENPDLKDFDILDTTAEISKDVISIIIIGILFLIFHDKREQVWIASPSIHVIMSLVVAILEDQARPE
jgi:hypothetical protein